jgi:hypothetical protein
LAVFGFLSLKTMPGNCSGRYSTAGKALAMVVVLSIHVEYVLLLYKEWGPCLGSPRGYNVSPQ